MDTIPRIVIKTSTEEITTPWSLAISKEGPEGCATLTMGQAVYVYRQEELHEVLEILCTEILRQRMEHTRLTIESNLGMAKETKGKHAFHDIQSFLRLFHCVCTIKAPPLVNLNYMA